MKAVPVSEKSNIKNQLGKSREYVIRLLVDQLPVVDGFRQWDAAVCARETPGGCCQTKPEKFSHKTAIAVLHQSGQQFVRSLNDYRQMWNHVFESEHPGYSESQLIAFVKSAFLPYFEHDANFLIRQAAPEKFNLPIGSLELAALRISAEVMPVVERLYSDIYRKLERFDDYELRSHAVAEQFHRGYRIRFIVENFVETVQALGHVMLKASYWQHANRR